MSQRGEPVQENTTVCSQRSQKPTIYRKRKRTDLFLKKVDFQLPTHVGYHELGTPSKPYHDGQKRSTISHSLYFYLAIIMILLVLTVKGVFQTNIQTVHVKTQLKISQTEAEPETIKIKPRFQPPPPLSYLLPKKHVDGRDFIVPVNHSDILVYTSVAVPVNRSTTGKPQTIIFLYTQGTVACATCKCVNLDVSNCMVGQERYPIVYDANGVYSCLFNGTLRFGEKITILVSPNIWRTKPIEGIATEEFENNLKELPRLEDGSYVVNSDVTWEDQIDPPKKDNEGRYKVCMMTQEKIFPEYIPEWIAYHRRIGVDYVYLYDNQSPKNLSQIYANADDVEVVHWPWERSQIQAHNHFLVTGRRRCQWAVLIDVDEFVMIRTDDLYNQEKPLKRYLRGMRERTDFSQIRLTSIALGSSGNIYRPRTPLAEAYWHLANLQDNLTKPIVWVGHTMPNSLVHRVEMAPTYYTHKSSSLIGEDENEVIGLMHMKYRSWHDYVTKAKGGRNSFQVAAWLFSANWSAHNPNPNHLKLRNTGEYVEFRNFWRKLMITKIQPPQLAPWDEAEIRTKTVARKGWAWKRRRGFGKTIMHQALVEYEKWLRVLKSWEIVKITLAAKMNRTLEL